MPVIGTWVLPVGSAVRQALVAAAGTHQGVPVAEHAEFTAERLAVQHERLAPAVAELIVGYARSLDGVPVMSELAPAELPPPFAGPLPDEGADPDEVLAALGRVVVPRSMNISSPRYFGLFNPTPLPVAVWTDALCSALNQNSAAWRQSPAVSVLEAVVVRWLCDIAGYPEHAFGTLTSGGSEANLIALKCARDAAASHASAHGLAGVPARLRVYASEQSHFSVVKSVDILGIGRENLREIPSDESFRVRVDALRDAIEQDLRAGFTPICVVGVAGSTSTGAIDPLDRLADVAAEYGLWFHVDAAYGGALALSPSHRWLLAGIERANSVTVDPHKWMFVPFSCGALLSRDGGDALRAAFDTAPEYLDERGTEDAHGADDDGLDFFRFGQMGTRRGNALKLWAALRSLGRRGYQEIIERQLALTRYLAAQLQELDDFDVVGDVQTAVCCFRFAPSGSDGTPWQRDDLQHLLQQRIERSGGAWVATTVLRGRRALRVNINSLLTQQRHVDDLIALLRREGSLIAAEQLQRC
jgi:aromatic-L-amino-acid/L-tryptophan decarboxylase